MAATAARAAREGRVPVWAANHPPGGTAGDGGRGGAGGAGIVGGSSGSGGRGRTGNAGLQYYAVTAVQVARAALAVLAAAASIEAGQVVPEATAAEPAMATSAAMVVNGRVGGDGGISGSRWRPAARRAPGVISGRAGAGVLAEPGGTARMGLSVVGTARGRSGWRRWCRQCRRRRRWRGGQRWPQAVPGGVGGYGLLGRAVLPVGWWCRRNGRRWQQSGAGPAAGTGGTVAWEPPVLSGEIGGQGADSGTGGTGGAGGTGAVLGQAARVVPAVPVGKAGPAAPTAEPGNQGVAVALEGPGSSSAGPIR